MKMMPGQAPYTAPELARLKRLISSALEAEELFSEDELERHASKMKAEESKPEVDLVGCSPNVYAVMARCRTAAQAAGWNQQRIGDFRGRLFVYDSHDGYEKAMAFVGEKFKVKS